MNVVLESLFLRRPRIEYVSPPVCPFIPQSASASGSSFLLQELCPPQSPTLESSFSDFVTWEPLPDICGNGGTENIACRVAELGYLIYKQDGEVFTPVTPFVKRGTTTVCQPGCYYATAVDANGVQVAVGDVVCTDGSALAYVVMPVAPGADRFNLYRTDDPNNPSGVYQLILYLYSGEAYESCSTACLKVGFVTPSGLTPLSNTVCVNVGCIPKTCPVGQAWNALSCSCVPITCPDPGTCPAGSIWNFLTCQCEMCPVQTCLPSQIWDPTICQCTACPVETCPEDYVWDPSICQCVLLPGPDWGHLVPTISVPFMIYQGNADGTFPPVFDTSSLEGGFNWFSSITMISGQVFNFAITEFNHYFVYSGSGAHCSMTVVIANVDPQNVNTTFLLTVNGAVAISGPGQGGAVIVPIVNGTTTVNFDLPAGTYNVALYVQQWAGQAPGSESQFTFTFHNIP